MLFTIRSAPLADTFRMRASPVSTLCLLTIAAALTGCASSGARIERPAPVASSTADHGRTAARIAQQQIGIRYRYGGTTPGAGFDCSGLVYYSFTQAGLPVPRTSRDQFRVARKIALRDALPGDIVFFQDQEKLSHVGIYLGGRRFVHAPSSGQTVAIADIDTPYYQEHLVAVGRLTPM
jgi:cell wall-associated NlpC family hydrolase